jgi:hypothetical protein
MKAAEKGGLLRCWLVPLSGACAFLDAPRVGIVTRIVQHDLQAEGRKLPIDKVQYLVRAAAMIDGGYAVDLVDRIVSFDGAHC